MKIVFTRKAQQSLLELGRYLLEQQLSASFVRNYLDELKTAMIALLETFPDAGVRTQVGKVVCRKLVVKGYSVLYQHEPDSSRVTILLIYRENIPIFT